MGVLWLNLPFKKDNRKHSQCRAGQMALWNLDHLKEWKIERKLDK